MSNFKGLIQTLKSRIVITKDGSHTLYSEQFGATYHSIHGAMIEGEHVFIKQGLLFQVERLGLKKLNILEMGFGSGLNAFLTYVANEKLQCQINYHSIEAFPIDLEEALTLNYTQAYSKEQQALFKTLHECEWNKEHVITEYFSLHKYNTSLENFTTNLKFDVIYYDAFSPTDQPDLWTAEVFTKMHDLLSDNGILVTYCAQGQMKRNMKAADFSIQALPGPPGKREMTRGLK